MFLEALAEELETDGVGQRGETVFVGFMPDHISVGVLILAPLIGNLVDHELPGMRRARFEAIVRHQDYESGMDLADDVVTALSLAEKQLTGVYVKYLRARHDPVVYPNSKGDQKEFAIVFDSAYILN